MYTFVDLKRAYDDIPCDKLIHMVKVNRHQYLLNDIAIDLYQVEIFFVKFGRSLPGPIHNSIGLWQGCILFPLLFNIYVLATSNN